MSFNGLARKFAQPTPPPMGAPAAPMAGPADPSMSMGMDPSMMPAAGAAPPADGANLNGQAPQKFTLGSLTNYIESDPDTAMEFLKTKIPNASVEFTNQQGQKQMTEIWSLLEPENWRNSDDETKGKVAGLIQENLPPELKAEETMGDEDSNIVPGVQKTVDIQASVAQADVAIRKFAAANGELLAKMYERRGECAKCGKPNRAENMQCCCGTKKAFNLTSRVKTANGLVQEVYPTLDGHNTVDLRTHQLINNLDIIERNKSWGLKPTDLFSRLGIDYDGFWQTHIMDRFYSEYRDKDGNWVGGYIQKRFEVDKNIPEFNNMQYRPGENRKPQRSANTEELLEKSRGGKVFNWVKAKSNVNVKTAQGNSFETEKFDFNRGEDKVRNASDAEIEYALKDLKDVIDIQEKDHRAGGHTPKLGYYWDEYHTYVGEKARRIKEGRWNPNQANPASSQIPAAGGGIGIGSDPTGVGMPNPVTASTKVAGKCCKQCGMAMMKGAEGMYCSACMKANSDEEIREAALKSAQKKK